MALTIETGQIVPGADSYVSLTDARALAAKYGLELPADNNLAEIALRNGANYIGLQEQQLCGYRVSPLQSLSFPRNGLKAYNFPISNITIPPQVILAQVIAAAEYGKGTQVRGSSDGRAVAMERVEGAVTVQYFDTGNNGSSFIITAALDALSPFLCGSAGFSFRVLRG